MLWQKFNHESNCQGIEYPAQKHNVRMRMKPESVIEPSDWLIIMPSQQKAEKRCNKEKYQWEFNQVLHCESRVQ
jgi:hypothetical protein